MTDSLFSIFPDGQLASGNDLKGKVARSKKQALCDVKNILQAKRTTGNEPLRKFGVQVPSNSVGSGNMCKDSLKQQFPVKGTPAKCLPVSEGTFKVACDEETVSWGSCGSCTELDEDFIFSMRPLSEQWTSEDIGYMAKGVFSLGLPMGKVDSEHVLEDVVVDLPSIGAWEDIEGFIPSVSLLSAEPSLVSYSDEE